MAIGEILFDLFPNYKRLGGAPFNFAYHLKNFGFDVRFIREMDTESGKFGRVIGGDGGHCDICNRLRVTSDGRIYPCLFYNQSFSVHELGINKAIEAALKSKPKSGDRSSNAFYRMGG